MKKFLFVLVSLVMSVSVFAQGKWAETKHEADQLAGTEEYTSYLYSDDNGAFVYWDNDKSKCRILTNTSFFNYDRSNSVYFKIGLYDENDKLLKIIELYLVSGHKSGRAKIAESDGSFNDIYNVGVKEYKKGYTADCLTEIINHLENNNGYVRFLSNLYGSGTFDFKVPCKNN